MSASDPLAPHRKPASGSDRAFGLVFAAVFALVGLMPMMQGASPRPWALGLAAGLLAVALAAPRLLAPGNRAWLRLGLALGMVATPLLMALIYAVAIVPVGLLLRARGRDLLRVRWQPEAPSYWIEREQPAPRPGSMARQF